jgi:predicted RNA-binding protein associated with RNAse of E/G family
MEIEPIDLNQDIDNPLTKYADEQRNKLVPKNEYKKTAFEYSSKNKNALADGDDKGRGTGIFLDIKNEKAGTSTDIMERKNGIKINKWKETNPYPNFIKKK